MSSFTNNESYKHNFAKEVFKEWCNSSAWLDGAWKSIYTNYIDKNEKEVKISWRSNRNEDAWLEYPIVVNNDVNSIETNWDEMWPGFLIDEDDYYIDNRFMNDFIPTYNECKELNLQPISVIDIVLPHKGQPRYFVEICHTNPVSNEKL